MTAVDREAFLSQLATTYPRAEWLVGYGVGASADEAERRAVVDAAGQIRSTIRGNVTSVEEGVFLSGNGETRTRIVDAVTQQVETDAGAFIQPVRHLSRQIDGVWQAAAVARRSDLDQKYVEKAQPVLAKLTALWKSTLVEAEWLQLARAVCEAQRLEHELDVLNGERWAVSRRSVWTEELRASARIAIAKREDARSHYRVHVASTNPEVPAQALDAIVGGLRKKGWAAELSTSGRCAAEGRGLVVEPRLGGSCTEAMTGLIVCRAALSFEVRPCSGALLFVVTSQEESGADSQNADRARRAALKKLKLDAPVEQVLERVLTALGDRCSDSQ